uniref:FANCI_S4 domain-containing protein n=1 Tax=Echinostoma caproni TaxID=27848 RepID=A0A183AHZ0_9TREM
LIGLLPNLMRVGRLFLEGLLKGAMPLFTTLFRYRGIEVTTLLRNTQSLTRFLQRVCTHAKAYRNARLANQIPSTRRCLETFVYRVKTMLSQNQCAEAFWLGTLKNRDLHGVELQDDSLLSRRTSSSLVSGICSQTSRSGRGRRGGRAGGPGRKRPTRRQNDDVSGNGRTDLNSDSDSSDTSVHRPSSGRSGLHQPEEESSVRDVSVRLNRITDDMMRDQAVVDREDEVEDASEDEDSSEGPVDEADVETVADDDEENEMGEEAEEEEEEEEDLVIDEEDAEDVLVEPSDEEEY